MSARAIAAGFLVLWAMSAASGQAPLRTPSDQYQDMLKTIDPNSADDHYRVGEWAFKNGLSDLALKELKTALALSPGHLRASILIKDVEAKVGKTPQTQIVGPFAGPEANAVGTTIPREWLVSDEDIYHVRMEELRPDERLPIQFRNNVIDRFIRKWRGREEFKEQGFEDRFRSAWIPARQVDFMREKNPEDTDVKNDILVQNDPKFMTDFRGKIWPIVAATCATTNCHGGGEPKGGLRLFNVGGRNDRIDHTNYVLLDGQVSRGRRMIDRSSPEDSLLLQFLLPEDLARFHHPVNIHAAAGSRRDVRYTVVLDWIRSLHPPPHPDYRLKYVPPMGMKIVGRSTPALPPPGGSSTPPPGDSNAPKP